MNKLVGITYDKRYLNHRIPMETKEGPDRLQRIYGILDKTDYPKSLRRYSPKNVSDQALLAVHSSFYLEQVERMTLNRNPYSYDKDTYLMEHSLNVARLAAGGCVNLSDAIMNDEVGRGFALVRPPGHHAESGRGMGFCILNSVAVTAHHLINTYGLDRVLILDIDIHHGNGTQEIFYESDNVLLVSLHQSSLFPYTGAPKECGKNQGLGYTLNVPIQRQWGDVEYSHLFGHVVQNAIEHFLPQFILVSCGFDGHKNETISDTCLSTDAYIQMTAALKYFADTFCDSRLMLILEGGYHPATLEETVLATMGELLSPRSDKPSFKYSSRAASMLKEMVPIELRNKWGFF